MKLETIVEKIAEKLPEDHTVSLHVENGSAWVELETPSGIVDIEQSPEETLAEIMQKALDLASRTATESNA